ncbi:MAG: hypothetical protein QXE23_09105 [Nitrososphaerota archaeon]
MRVRIQWNVTPERFAEELREVVLRKAQEHIRKKLAGLQCPQHHRPVEVSGSGSELYIRACCQAAIDLAKDRLK